MAIMSRKSEPSCQRIRAILSASPVHLLKGTGRKNAAISTLSGPSYQSFHLIIEKMGA
jgi:hypothetical protein